MHKGIITTTTYLLKVHSLAMHYYMGNCMQTQEVK